MKLKVYVGGSSAEWERARWWMNALRESGIEVTSTWVDSILEHGANPADATDAQRKGWARRCLAEIEGSDIVWILVPDGNPGRGAYFEAGFATARAMPVVYSGDTYQSIFPALDKEFGHDEEALHYLFGVAEELA